MKGTVSRELRWVLLYINRKLFSRAVVGRRKIVILLKGHLTFYKRRSSIRTALQFTILDVAITIAGYSFIREHLDKALQYSQDSRI